jgi:hypothetical protein
MLRLGLLLLGVADRNAFVFRGSRVRGRICCRYEAPSYCATVNWFGWYSFCHCVILWGWLYSPWLVVKSSSLALVLDTPWPRGTTCLPLKTGISVNFMVDLGATQNYSEGAGFPSIKFCLRATVGAVAFGFSVRIFNPPSDRRLEHSCAIQRHL